MLYVPSTQHSSHDKKRFGMGHKTDKAAKRKAKLKAKRVQEEQFRRQLNDRIANAIMDLCADVLPDYADDSKGPDLDARRILWQFGMIAWNLAVAGQKEIDSATIQNMRLNSEAQKLVRDEINSLIRRKYEKYPGIRTTVNDISLNTSAGTVVLKVSLGDTFPPMPIPDFSEPARPELTPEVLRAKRKELGLTQVKFAAELGVSAKTVSAWEHGKTAPNEIVSERILNLLKDQE